MSLDDTQLMSSQWGEHLMLFVSKEVTITTRRLLKVLDSIGVAS